MIKFKRIDSSTPNIEHVTITQNQLCTVDASLLNSDDYQYATSNGQ